MRRILLLFGGAKKYISLINTGALLAIITPLAYLLGVSFHQGYLSAFGLESNNFQASVQDIYINSYVVIGKILIDAGVYIATIFQFPNLIVLAMILLSLALIIYLSLFAKKKLAAMGMGECKCLEYIENASAFLSYKKNDFSKSILITLVSMEIVSITLMIILLIPLLWWAIPLVGSSTAKELATSKINKFKIDGCSNDRDKGVNNCFIVRDETGNILHEGLLVAMNEKEIAIFKKEGLFIFSRRENFILQRKTN